MVFAEDENSAQRLRSLGNHGQQKRYYHEEIGINSRLDTIQASILLAKFTHFEEEIKRREDAAQRYNKLLEDIVPKVTLPFVPEDRTSVYAQYTIRITDGKRDMVANNLNKEGIPTAIHYPLPLHLQPCFASLGYREGELPMTEKAAREVLSLPMHPFITIKEQEIVADAIGRALIMLNVQ
jgi:UDP-2-acetamido-2-deoxy-ribo-hexuluronate aminotransferase